MRVISIVKIFLVALSCVCCVTQFFTYQVLAQEITNFVPPSPNASSLGQYGETPVSYYTGTPAINIPLYEVKSRNLSIPVSLSYHASGIKVNQRSGDVGLGWALNAGGVITRTIVGKADEHSSLGFRAIASMLKDFREDEMTYDERMIFLERCAGGVYDTKPDIYYYNFLGYSGKLVFDEKGQALLIPHRKMTVEFGALGGLVTTANGTRYYFGDTEYSSVSSGEESTEGITAWYLSKIVSVQGDTINFSYSEPYRVRYDLYQGEIQKKLIDGNSPIDCSQDILPVQSDGTYDADKIDLEEISTASTKVKFIRTPGGLGEQQNLTAIEVYDRQDLINPIRSFDLHYGSFGQYRPRLDSLQELAGNLTKPPHRFYYNDIDLPEYGSKAQDHWGYYNGKSTNQYLIPRQETASDFMVGAERTPDPSYSIASLLEEIHYPTGGSTVFEYEGHDYSNGSERHITNSQIEKIIAEDTTISMVIDNDLGQWATLSHYPSIPEGLEDAINELTGGVSLIYHGESPCLHSPHLLPIALEPSNQKVYLCKGTYILRAETDDPGVVIDGRLTYETPTGKKQRIFPAGGVRIRTISNYADREGTLLTTVRRFDYRDGNLSSGRLVSNVQYHNYEYAYSYMKMTGSNGGFPVYKPVTCQYMVYTSSGKVALGVTQGSSIGYSQVTVYENDVQLSGKTVYEYTSPRDYVDAIDQNAGTVNSNDYKRGLLVRQTDYVYRDKQYLKVKKLENSYHFNDSFNYQLHGLGTRFKDEDRINLSHRFYEGIYAHTSRWFYRSGSVETFYGQSMMDSLSTATTYLYENNNHLQPTQIITETSDGRSRSKEIKYAADFGNTTMTDAHMHSQVLESISKVDGLPTRKTTTQYSLEHDHIIPTMVQNFPDGGSENISTTYQYNANGNIIEVRKEGDYNTVYLWGYNQTLLIAKMENTVYSDLPAADVANIYALSDADDDHCEDKGNCNEAALRAALNDLRIVAMLSEALITTYTYDPLVGLTSQTGPDGRTTYYEYDDFGRLERVRDHKRHILKEIDYQYHSE